VSWKLVVTHENTDFDGLASMLAAWKLWPDVKPILPRRPNRNLRDFLTLYGGELPFLSAGDLPRRIQVDRVIAVDTHSFITPRGVSDTTPVDVIDHHARPPDLPDHYTFSGEEIGATTTLLLEQIIARQIAVSRIEATLLALGIYEDTGSLTYQTTTARDVRCAAWLLEHGANLEVVNDFIHHPLTAEQQTLYTQLMESAETVTVSGYDIILTQADAPGYVEEISTLAHRLRDLYDPDGLFLLVNLGDHVQLVARATEGAVDVGHIAEHLGGGGHSSAAAALVRGRTLPDLHDEIVELLERHVKPSITVAEIMSHGVHTLLPSTRVNAAAQLMRRYGHEGFPVVDDGRVVGVLSRRDIDRALQHKLGNMPISDYMQAGRIQVRPDDSIETLQQLMVQHGVGQVPVVENDRVVGIVTRTDLIKLWARPGRKPSRKAEIQRRMGEALPFPLLNLIRLAGRLAQERKTSVYVVGGFVRDLLLGAPTLDMDMVVEGDAIDFTEELSRRAGGRVQSHRRFGTAKLIFEGQEEKLGVSSLDFASARTEFYASPTALPEVERSSIKQDLHRRDFTINTLAIRLDSGHYGQLFDFYGGERDLQVGLIRVLHSLSFVEDPTRMLRAARLEQRLGFDIEPRTEELIGNALPLLARVTGERIRHELYLILREEHPERALARLEALGVLAHIHPSLSALAQDVHIWQCFEALRAEVETGEWGLLPGPPSPGLYIGVLTASLSRFELEALTARLHIFRADMDLLYEIQDLQDLAPALSVAEAELSNSQLARLLRRTTTAGRLAFCLCCSSEQACQRVRLYERTLRHVRPTVDGNYLIELGLSPGPQFGDILDAVRDALLDGQIHTPEEERALVDQLLERGA
jgi:tRNA nucleotidyltransferase (CCA-adding enzyme)